MQHAAPSIAFGGILCYNKEKAKTLVERIGTIR